MDIAKLSEIINSEMPDELEEKIINKYNEIIKEGFKLTSSKEEIMRDAAHGGFDNGKYDINSFNKLYSIFSFEDDKNNKRYLIIDEDKNVVKSCLSKLKFERFNVSGINFADRFDKALNYYRKYNNIGLTLDDIYQISASLKKDIPLDKFLNESIESTIINAEYADAYAIKYATKIKNPRVRILKELGVELDKINLNPHTTKALANVSKQSILKNVEETLREDDIDNCPSLNLMNTEQKKLLVKKLSTERGKEWLRAALSVTKLDNKDRIKEFVPPNKVVKQIFSSIKSIPENELNLDNLRYDIINSLAAINSLKFLSDEAKENFQKDFIKKVLTDNNYIDYKQYAYFINHLVNPLDVINPEYDVVFLEEQVKKESEQKNIKPKKDKIKNNALTTIDEIFKSKKLKDFVSSKDGKIIIDINDDIKSLILDGKKIDLDKVYFTFNPTEENKDNVSLFVGSILRENFTVEGISDYIDNLQNNLSLDELINSNRQEKPSIQIVKPQNIQEIL